MRITVVIPTYWGRSAEESWRQGDAVYDHPTAIDGEDTLTRTLESMKILENKQFKLVIPICTIHPDLNQVARERVEAIVNEVGLPVETYLFDEPMLERIRSTLDERVSEVLQIRGYSNVRNICLLVGHVLASDITILIDDDEIFEDPTFVDKAVFHVGKRIYGRNVYGVAGYYLNKYDEFYDDVEIEPWMTYWNRFGSKSKAFDKIIKCDPRLKVTPFAFGGLMVIHRNMYRIVPFDPGVKRGEDVDYLINAKMFGFDFFLDNLLNIKHLPPQKHHPTWKRLREDLYRFLYEQAKIRSQYEVINMNRISEEAFDPYPGEFLKEDLEDKIFKTNILLALDYLSHGNVEGCQESLRNIYLSKYEAKPKEDPFTEYRALQKRWVEMMAEVSNRRMRLRQIMETGNLSKYRLKARVPIQDLTQEEVIQKLLKFNDFGELSKAELLALAEDAYLCGYDTDEVIFKKGDQQMRFSLVISGCVRIVNFNSQNEEIGIGVVCSGGVLGETVLLKQEYNVYAIANEPVEMLCFEKKDIEKIIKSNPMLGNKVLYILLDRIYYKLRATSQKYEDKILMEEDLSTNNEEGL